jgi:ribosome-binding protein aMBF1 (putative translation factor)
MTNKENFLQLVEKEESTTLEKAEQRQKNRAMLRESQKIASKILAKLDKLEWSQKQLAEKMEVSPQYVNKILRGKENLTLDTLIRLQEILNIPLLASFSEDMVS